MKITKDVDYAIRIVLFLATKKNFTATKHEISKNMHIPSQYLSKIAQQLHRNKLVEITQGPKGRYSLLKTPENISMLDVVESIKGEIYLNYCVKTPEKCFRKGACEVNNIWNELTFEVRNFLKNKNFKDILKKELCFFENKL